MPDPKVRLNAILDHYRCRYPEDSEISLLRKIDSRIVPLLSTKVDSLPVSKETLNGFSELLDALDNKLVDIGLSEFKNHERLSKAKAYFSSPGTSFEDVLPHLETYNNIRQSIWNSVSTK